MTTNPRIPVALVALVAALATSSACSRAGADATADQRAAGRPAVAVEVLRVGPTDLEESIDVVGSLAPKVEAEIKSEYSGIVTAVYVTEWVHVQRGTPLAALDRREVETAAEAVKAGVMQAEVAETRAVRELERANNMKEYGLVTAQQLDDARTARDAASAATAAARAQMRAVETRRAKLVIRSPIDGVVASRGVNVGDRVENMGGNVPMFVVVDSRVLQLTATVPSAGLATLRVGQAIEFEVDAMPGRTFSGKVMFINPTVDPVTRAVRVLADVPNDKGELKGGLFVKGRIVTGTRSGVLQVPRIALQNWNLEKGTADVFVLKGNTVIRRAVSTGRDEGGSVEITNGLAAGDEVVSRGAFNIRDGDRVKVAAQGT